MFGISFYLLLATSVNFYTHVYGSPQIPKLDQNPSTDIAIMILDRLAAHMRKTESLEGAMIDQDKRIKQLENTVRSQSNTIESLFTLIRSQDHLVHSLQQRLDDKQMNSSQSRTDENFRRAERQDQINSEQQLQPEHNNHGDKDGYVQTASHFRRKSNENRIRTLPQSVPTLPQAMAFSVYVDKHAVYNGSNTVITYDGVLLNDGNHYSPVDGVFTCPYKGVYLFTFNIASTMGKGVGAKLVQDGQAMVNAIAISASSTSKAFLSLEVSGNTAVLRCKQGQRVWVVTDKNFLPSELSLAIANPAHFSTFSGVLLYGDI